MAEVRPTLRIERPPKNLRELVQDAIREAILDLRFKPGDRLVERSLCQQLGVSRTVIREVLRYLEAEGLIEVLPNRGPVVATIKPSEAEEIYELRGLLEGMAAAACAKLATPDDLRALKQAIEELRTASVTGDARMSLRAADRFYQHVFMVSGKTVAWQVVESLYVRINALRAVTITTPERQKVSLGEMERILKAIVSGDADAAKIAAIDHVQKAAAVARRTMDDSASVDILGNGAPQPKRQAKR